MDEGFDRFSRRHRESLISGISAGFFVLVVGVFLVAMPGLLDRVIKFLQDFDLVRVPNLGIYWPAPLSPFAVSHREVYLAIERFSFIWGIFQLVVIGLRLAFRSPVNKTAETVSNLVFWFGNGFLVRTFLLETVRLPSIIGFTRWFVFWAALVMLLGVTLIVRAIIVAAVPKRYLT